MMNLLTSIARMLERKPQWSGPLGQLSENPVALAEVLLLFRMVLADGVAQPSQLTAFERICQRQFGISRRDMPDLHVLLDSPRARSSDVEAFSLLRQLDTKARSTLLDDMMRIARANATIDERDEKMIRRMASLLGLDPGSMPMAEKDEVMTDTPHTDTPDKRPSLGERVRGFLDHHASLSKVAHDPVLTAELLLLARMSFADKSVEPAEADAFAAICTRLLGLNGEELTDILKYLNEFGYETSDAQAADMLADLDEARKREILAHLSAIAQADGEVDERERKLFQATARRLGFS
ncbi:MAG: TerB family tellurite resistance protein [Hoeflea sp.]|uniref:TerB family tellurite resistance protein n=1 Tax=Hoeflea sp. TaxID=1940281 RepID=UPI00329A3E47